MEDLVTQELEIVVPNTPPSKRHRDDSCGSPPEHKRHKGLEFEQAIMILQTSTQQLQESLQLVGPPPPYKESESQEQVLQIRGAVCGWDHPSLQLTHEIAKNAERIRLVIQKAIDLQYGRKE